MRVRIFGTLRQFAGAKAVQVDVEAGDTVRTLLHKLTVENRVLREKILDDTGNLRPSIHVLVNGRSTRYLDGLDSILAQGDLVALFPAVGGG
jgi:molybdopterin synthase sulfur carrier subunit